MLQKFTRLNYKLISVIFFISVSFIIATPQSKAGDELYCHSASYSPNCISNYEPCTFCSSYTSTCTVNAVNDTIDLNTFSQLASCADGSAKCQTAACPSDNSSLNDGDQCVVRKLYGSSIASNNGKWDISEKKCIICLGGKEIRVCGDSGTIGLDSSSNCTIPADNAFDTACSTTVNPSCDEQVQGYSCAVGKECDSTGACVPIATATPTATPTATATLPPTSCPGNRLKCEAALIAGVIPCDCGSSAASVGDFCCGADSALFGSQASCLASPGCAATATPTATATLPPTSCPGNRLKCEGSLPAFVIPCDCGSAAASAGQYCCGTDSALFGSQAACLASPGCIATGTPTGTATGTVTGTVTASGTPGTCNKGDGCKLACVPPDPDCGNAVGNSPVFKPFTISNSFEALTQNITGWILGIIGSLALLFLIIGGIMYIGAGGDQDRIKTAKSIITAVIIGLIVVIASYSIINEVKKILGY